VFYGYLAGVLAATYILAAFAWEEEGGARENLPAIAFVSLLWPIVLAVLAMWALIYGPGLVVEARRRGRQ
jgi:hypothetical protein